MLLQDLQNKNILIWGMGTEGQSVKTYLQKHNIGREIYEYNDADGVETLHKLSALADVVVRSPGVSIYKTEYRELLEQRKFITSSSNLFLAETKAHHPLTQVIGVTGSKGKTLSVSMMYHMMTALGLKVGLGGNIGKPLIELLDDEYDYVIGEFSSYQASDLATSPDVVMFTNLFSVHTDWHGGHEGYCRDKVHLAQYAKTAVVNVNNPELMKYTQSLPHKVFYGQKEGFYAQDKILYYRGEEVCNIDNLQINGNHNMENLAGVLTVMNCLGLDWRKGLQSLPKFEQVAHRLQDIGVIGGVRFINDSISTAPEAAISAMKSFDDNLIIISGGTVNQQNYADYARFIESNPKVKAAITLFQCGPQIAGDIKNYVKRDGFRLIEAETLAQAVTEAYRIAHEDGATLVLFSPTAPSFGFYKNFMARGEDFINCVKTLAK
jgi:UDP-N-acetylmuramoylalanine--D-glutamate ligase